MALPRKISSPIVRLYVRREEHADEPPPITRERPRGSRRPHTDMTYAKVRELIEHTALTYEQIGAQTGVCSGTISNWTRDGKWVRPLDAPRASDRLPTVRAGRRLKLRKLASRLQWMAERYVQKLEETPDVDLDLMMQALQVLKMARLEAMGNRRRLPLFGPPQTGREYYDREQAIRTALKAMRRGGVDLDRAPQEALDLVLEARAPPEDNPALRDPTPRSRSNPEHAQLLWPNGRGKWRGPGARRRRSDT
jgi:transcriptional regulator with XRE-family HTH domain